MISDAPMRWCLISSHLAILFLSAFLLAPIALAQTTTPRSPLIRHHTHRYHAKRSSVPYGARIGAVCRDGVVTSETGKNACAHHGGVKRWQTR